MNSIELKMGVIGGILFSLFGQIPLKSVTETVVLASLGAIVSFIISRALQRLVKNKSC